MEIAFGPVPSWRLGQSLGINNEPAKTCGYSNVCRQLGPALATEGKRRAFLAKAGAGWTLVTRLLDAGQLDEMRQGGSRFFIRHRLAGHRKSEKVASQ